MATILLGLRMQARAQRYIELAAVEERFAALVHDDLSERAHMRQQKNMNGGNKRPTDSDPLSLSQLSRNDCVLDWQWESRRCFRFVSRCSAWLTTGLPEPKGISAIAAGKCQYQMRSASPPYVLFARPLCGHAPGARFGHASRTYAESV